MKMCHSVRACLCIGAAALVLAPYTVARSAGQGTAGARVGKVSINADSSEAGPGYFLYKNAHMTADNGASLDADELRANLNRASFGLMNITAAGHVLVHVEQIAEGRAYTVKANKAVYDPKTNRVDLSGHVETTIDSPYTQGPLVQSGDTARIQLGSGPTYPLITMTHVHTVFTPQQ